MCDPQALCQCLSSGTASRQRPCLAGQRWLPCGPTPLHALLAEANLLFGRGFRAGIDRREQKKTAAESEAEILRRQRVQSGASDFGKTLLLCEAVPAVS
jgi:hypothetical protein